MAGMGSLVSTLGFEVFQGGQQSFSVLSIWTGG
jgi:hypothetical protein